MKFDTSRKRKRLVAFFFIGFLLFGNVAYATPVLMTIGQLAKPTVCMLSLELRVPQSEIMQPKKNG